MAEYYRNWNLVVHDWLYAYIYKDVAQVNIEENERKKEKRKKLVRDRHINGYWLYAYIYKDVAQVIILLLIGIWHKRIKYETM